MRPTLIHSRQPDRPRASEGTALDVLLWDGQTEFHQQAAALAYAKLRRRAKSIGLLPMRDVVRKTYIDGLSLVPGNLELMEFEHILVRPLARSRPSGWQAAKTVGHDADGSEKSNQRKN